MLKEQMDGVIEIVVEQVAKKHITKEYLAGVGIYSCLRRSNNTWFDESSC